MQGDPLKRERSDPPQLIPDFDSQEEVFARAFTILRDAVNPNSPTTAFPGASIAVTQAGRLIAHQAFGHFTYDPGSPAINSATLFDLASVTKAIATTTMAAILYERGLLELDGPVAGVVPEFLADNSEDRRREVSFRMLLAHSSGLPAYEKLFLKARSRDELLQRAFTTPLKHDPGAHAEYSDIGFIILGSALERIAGETIDEFCRHDVFGPSAMASTTFNPPGALRDRIPPTADERDANPTTRSTFRERIVQGEVQDENAFVLGGVAGHAGLFSTAGDVARFAHAMLQSGVGRTLVEDSPTAFLRSETVALFTARQFAPEGTSRALGWDTPSQPSQSGKYFGPNSFGHLGYTGTSVWIDPDRQLSITLLTNRTWRDCQNQRIKQVRPQFHDAVIESLNSAK